MKTLKYILLIIIASLLAVSCEELVDSLADDEPPPVEEPPADNPVDPDFQPDPDDPNPPEPIRFVLTPEILDDLLQIEFDLTGVEFSDVDLEYNYEVDITAPTQANLFSSNGFQQFNVSDFTNGFEFPQLDDGSYSLDFAVRFQGESANLFDTTLAFDVDLIRGPSLLFFPKRTENIQAGGTFEVSFVANELSNLAGGRIELQFPSSLLQYNGSESGPFLNSSGGNLVEFVDVEAAGSNTILRFSFALLDVDDGISGSGVLATIDFNVTGSAGQSGTIGIRSNSTSLRTFDNQTITVSNLVNKSFVIE